MPERPDLEYVVPLLDAALRGKTVEAVRVADPVVLRLAVEGDLSEHLVGRTFSGVRRHGAWVRFALDGDNELAVQPMLAGRFVLAEIGAKSPRDVVVGLALSDGQELRYRDDVRMGKVWIFPRGREAMVPGLAKVGIDVLSPAFTREAFRALANKRREQAKLFLLDKAALDSLGNAYADESLHAGGIHPKARVNALSAEQLDRLHDAIVEVLSAARDEIRRRGPATDEKVRDFLKVRNRKGQPCPACGTKIRVVGVRGEDAFFCPRCQPDAAGAGFVDWSKGGRA